MVKSWCALLVVVAGVGCKSSAESVTNSMNIVTSVPGDFTAAVRAAISRVEIVLDEPPSGFSLFSSAGTPQAATSDEGYAVTAEILDIDGDAKLEQRVTIIANPFESRDSWSLYLAGAALGDGFVVRGKVYRVDAGTNELVAEAAATTDSAGNVIQFGGGLKTVALNFNCVTNVACRDGAPNTVLDRDAGPAALSNIVSPTFNFSCTVPPCTFACALDDAGPVACASGVDAGPLADGVHSFSVRATDDAGRADPTPAAMTWTIDGTRPSSLLTSITTGPVAYGTTVNVDGTASDALSGVARVQVSVDGGANWFDATGLVSWAASFTAGFFAHQILVRATDDAGNVEVPDGGQTLYAMGIPATTRLGVGASADFTAGCMGSGNVGLYEPTAVIHDMVYNRLHIVDSKNHRVVIHALSAEGNPVDAVADYALGQASPNHCVAATAVTGASLNTPWGAYLNGSKLYVSDRDNNRVLGIRIEILANGLSANDVLGQPDFTTSDAGSGAAGLNAPTGIAYDSQSPTYLFVADTGNNRVLIYDLWQSDAGEAAIAVLGQTDFDGSASGTSATSLREPMGLAFDGPNRRLFVADRSNSRVVVYQVPSPIDGGFAAKWVLGQPDMSSASWNTTASSLNAPEALSYDTDAGQLYVSDTGNNRVLVFDVKAIDAGEAAIAVIGQPKFDAGAASVSQSRLDNPVGIGFVGGSLNRLYIADRDNNRVVAYNVASVQDAGSASVLVGHPDGDGGPVWESNCVNGPTDQSVTHLWGLAIDGTGNRLFAGDGIPNARIAVFGLTTAGLPASYTAMNVLGQNDFWHCTPQILASPGPGSLSLPTGIAFDNARNRLFVADLFGGRVAVFDFAQGGLTDGMNASAVLGRSTMDAGYEYYCNPTAAHACSPVSVAYDSARDRLFAGDYAANRVVVYEFDGGAAATGMSATYVLGQDNFVAKDAGTAANRMWNPVGLAFDGVADRLYVSEIYNHRVLMFDFDAGIANGMAASRVVGQADFVSAVDGGGAGQLNEPGGLAVDTERRRLFVADVKNNRIQVWDTTNLTNGAAPVNVIGQTSLATTGAGLTEAGLKMPLGLALHPNGRWLWVLEFETSRILTFDVGR